MTIAPDRDVTFSNEEPAEASILQIRGRIHKLADTVQKHEGQLIQHATVIPLLTQQLEALRSEAATREGVTAAINTLKLQMESTAREYTLKLNQIQEALSPIQRALNWTVALIIGSVILASLALVLKTT